MKTNGFLQEFNKQPTTHAKFNGNTIRTVYKNRYDVEIERVRKTVC